MAVTQAELVKAWQTVLDLCKVKKTETAALLTRPGANTRNIEAAHQALENVGCPVYQLEPVLRDRPLRESKGADASRSARRNRRARGLRAWRSVVW